MQKHKPEAEAPSFILCITCETLCVKWLRCSLLTRPAPCVLPRSAFRYFFPAPICTSVICCRGRGWSGAWWSAWIPNFQEFAGLSSMLPLSDSSAVGDLSGTCHHDSLLEFWSWTGSDLEFVLFLVLAFAGFCWFWRNCRDSVADSPDLPRCWCEVDRGINNSGEL